MKENINKFKYIFSRTVILSAVLCPAILLMAPSKEKIEMRERKQTIACEVYNIAKGDEDFSLKEKKSLLNSLNVNIPINSKELVVLGVDFKNNYKIHVSPSFFSLSQSQKVEDKLVEDYLAKNKEQSKSKGFDSLCKKLF